MPHLEDDDKTVIRPKSKTDSNSSGSASNGEEADHGALPLGTRIGEFEVKALIGVGGFGIVYLAHDHSLGRDVALKEYMPSSLAARTNGITVSVKSQRHAETFTAGMKSFINEARLLAQFDSASLVKVYRFWEANGTAYMVMPFYEGLTLKQALAEMRTPPTEDWLKKLLVPLMDALQLLHHENCFHRDIAPDNILLLKSGRPVLLDFGAARKVIGDLDKALTVILKPGYAPIEQYADEPNMRQGAWTDIYAVAAVVHFAIMGKPPTPSVGRLINDTAVPLAKAAAGRYSDGFLRGLDKALAVKPQDRPQDLGEFRNIINLEEQTHTQVEPIRSQTANASPDHYEGKRRKRLFVGFGAVFCVAIGIGGYLMLIRQPGSSTSAARPSPMSDAMDKAAKTSPEPPQTKPVVADPIAPMAPTTANTPTPPTSAPSADGKAAAFDPLVALEQLYDRREQSWAVTVGLEKTEVKIGKEKLTFRVQSEKPGYLYILMEGTDKGHLYLLFPNALDKNNKVAAGKEINLPRPGWAMTAGGPPGINQFVAMVTDQPRDFSKVELTKAGAFSEFPTARVESMLRANTSDAAVLAGTPICASATNCSAAYGAARFMIAEIN